MKLHGVSPYLPGLPLGHMGQVCAPYQVVDLVVPPTGHKHHLACLLRDLQRWAAVLVQRVQAGIQE